VGGYPPLPDKPSIAVLPFPNMSGDPEQEYFADGMVEEIITAQSRIKWLFVLARNASFRYKGQAVDVKQVRRERGLRCVLEGSVRKSGGRGRITRQLIDPTRGVHLWTDRFACGAENNPGGYCNLEVDKLIDRQSIEFDPEKRKKLVWGIERRLAKDGARPVIYHTRSATCRQPYVKGFDSIINSVYNGWRFEDLWLDK
jgi:TolB-like protein